MQGAIALPRNGSPSNTASTAVVRCFAYTQTPLQRTAPVLR